ncbi:MAG: hypothetical protein H7Z14_20645 [Anaerolineae bacterium]|nr:hypothetical protein [Phycisphaerae bacterium]
MIEIVFAILVMGIGSVLMASLFVTSISLSQQNLDDTTAAATARNAFALLSTSMTHENTPPQGATLRPLNSSQALWQSISGNLINASDPRYAWTALFERQDGAGVARVVIFVERVKNRSTFDPAADLFEDPNDITGRGCSLQARPIDVMVRAEIDAPGGVMQFDTESPNAAAAAEGAFVVLAGGPDGAGRVLRLGNAKNAALGEWYLFPGYEIRRPEDEVKTPATAYLVGRGYADPRRPVAGFDGPSQDIAVYTSWVLLRSD